MQPITSLTVGDDMFVGMRFMHPSRSANGWELARYELPVTETLRPNSRYIDVAVGDTEQLAYVHRHTGKRVEFTRPRLNNTAAALEEATAKWECELAFAEEAKERATTSCIVGYINLDEVRTTKRIVEEWHRKAKDPDWVKWPTKLSGVKGAFGRVANHMESK